MTESVERIRCCIVGCGRTFKRQPDDHENVQLMCGRHWRMADTKLRDRNKLARKRLRKIERLALRAAIQNKGIHRIYRAWHRAAAVCNSTWEAVREDSQIKAVFGAEDAPRRTAKEMAR